MISAVLGLLVATGPAVAHPRGIPDRLMLQPADLGGAVPGPVEEGLVWPLLPQPCADRPIPQPVASRTQAADYNTRYRVYQNVARFRGDGAQRYLTELKAQLADCGVGGGDNGLDPVAEDHLGPDTVLFTGNYDLGDRWVAYVAAAVGRHVVVIMVSDSYLGAGDLTLANGLAQGAMNRLRQAAAESAVPYGVRPAGA
ncbi:hypothetical protein [Paractinoplanes lichenicola]|uniref:PknH-like extracellular domain-containing protein n=1 Tax=Paractinoplanes lichenicola TaxID=2802976 RepID=A0ABS1W0F5_9ACTN|nr:hypothetical protein [Actinoplanes lichenicola]MBL7260173.1 hypothetical protein [Actinoplanes lichenicola]